MKIIAYVVPFLLILLTIYCIIKKIKIYDVFVNGTSNAIPLVVEIFPYLVAIFIISELFDISGLSTLIIKFLKPVVKFLGVPEEITKLILLKPFSGSGSLALLTDIYKTYGVNSYISIVASAVYGSSETIFYIGAVYFAGLKRKSLTAAIVISLISFVASIIFGCFLCKIM
jgi:spore maturation protein B